MVSSNKNVQEDLSQKKAVKNLKQKPIDKFAKEFKLDRIDLQKANVMKLY